MPLSTFTQEELILATTGELANAGFGDGVVRVLIGLDCMGAILLLSTGTSWRACELGLLWGVVHSLMLFFAAIIYVSASHSFDIDAASFIFDFIVGLMLILLGMWALKQYLRVRKRVLNGESIHEILMDEDLPVKSPTDQSPPSWLHNSRHLETTTPNSSRNPHDTFKIAGRPRLCLTSAGVTNVHTLRLISIVYGTVHGLAGEGGTLTALPDDVVDDWGRTMSFLLAYMAASTLTMGLLAALYGEISHRIMRRSNELYYRVGIFSSLVPIVAGVVWIVLVESGELDNVW